MNSCPNCGAALALEERYCPRCGAAVRSTKTRNITVTLSRRDARRGCVRLLRYPGAPSAIKVRLPGRLYNGAELYINGVSFLTGDGSIVKGALRITVSVKRRRILPVLAVLVVLMASAAGLLYATDMALPQMVRVLEILSPQPSPAPVPEQELPAFSPTPTPYVSPLRPMQQQAATIIPNFELRYYLMELDDRLLENFCALYTAVQNFESECEFPLDLSRQELSNLMLLLSYECPELLQFSAATEMSYLVDESGNVLSVMLELCLSQEEYTAQYQRCAQLVRGLASETVGMTEYEKELYAYEYLSNNCFYDFEAPWSASAYGALIDGHAKCDGISLAMKWLCEEMGVSCMVIAGRQPGEEIGHAWNIVCIDGTYYDLDVTNDVNSHDRSMRYYGAFNVSRHWIRDKYPDNVSFSGFIILPGSESMGMSYHSLNGSFVSQGQDAQAILFEKLDAMENEESVYIQFESAQQYQDFINNINDIMAAWDGISRGSFNFSLSHLDEFQVCCISVSFI